MPDVRMFRSLDGQKSGWPDVRMARSPNGQKDSWPEGQMAKRTVCLKGRYLDDYMVYIGYTYKTNPEILV